MPPLQIPQYFRSAGEALIGHLMILVSTIDCFPNPVADPIGSSTLGPIEGTPSLRFVSPDAHQTKAPPSYPPQVSKSSGVQWFKYIACQPLCPYIRKTLNHGRGFPLTLCIVSELHPSHEDIARMHFCSRILWSLQHCYAACCRWTQF